MASGDPLLQFMPYANEPPSANYATLDTRNGHPALDFDGSTAESAVFSGVMPSNYGASGVDINLYIAFTSATSGNAIFSAAMERVTAQDIDADGFATAVNSSAIAANGTSGILTKATIALTNGAQMDSVAAGEMFRLKIARVPADASDDIATDAELLAVYVEET